MKQKIYILCFLIFLFTACREGAGPDSITKLDKTNTQPDKAIAENCTDKCHKPGTFMDPILINSEGREGKHKKHAGERQLPCGTCHFGYQSMESHRNNVLDAENPNVRLVYFDEINWKPDDNRRGYWTGDTGLIDGKKTGGCKDIYCHGNKPNGGDPDDYPKWYEDVTFECTYCHNPGAPIDPTTNYERFPEEKHSSDIVSSYNGEACTSSGCHDGDSGLGFFQTSALVPANAHPRHVNDAGFECTLCHLDYKEKLTHANGVLNSATDLNTATESQKKINFNPVLNPRGTYDAENRTCNNLYCHGDSWGDSSNERDDISKGADTTPVWTDISTGNCGNCHRADPTHQQGAHSKHLNPPYSFPCYKCHYDQRADGVTREDHHTKDALPVNGVVNIIFDRSTLPANPAGIFDSTAKTCQSLYCHGTKLPANSNGTDTIPDWNWGNNRDVSADGEDSESTSTFLGPKPWCGTCHDVDASDSSPGTERATGRHTFHLKDNSDDTYPVNGPDIDLCTKCHSGDYGSPKNSTTFIQDSNHVNGVVSFNDSSPLGSGNIWGTDPGSPGQWAFEATNDIEEEKACSTASCHGSNVSIKDALHSMLKKAPGLNMEHPDATADGTGTTACDNCHSATGSYNGVEDPDIGAKFNWRDGVYTTMQSQGATINISLEAFGLTARTNLKPGKEKWCAGCHDTPASSIQTENIPVPIIAPKVAGDENDPSYYGPGWGFYKTGHGVPAEETMPWTGTLANRDASGNWSTDGRPGADRNCPDCHNPTLLHIDGKPRTFDCLQDPCLATPADYQSGYRLRPVREGMTNYPPLEVPRTSGGIVSTNDFRLCFQCHDYKRFTNEAVDQTNFRDIVNYNRHTYHLLNTWKRFYADWRDYGSGSSDVTCVQCHNVHGSKQPSMIRGGELTEGYRLYLVYSDGTQCGNMGTWNPTNPEVLLMDSIGSCVKKDVARTSPSKGVCVSGCHGVPYTIYNRTPLPLLLPN